MDRQTTSRAEITVTLLEMFVWGVLAGVTVGADHRQGIAAVAVVSALLLALAHLAIYMVRLKRTRNINGTA